MAVFNIWDSATQTELVNRSLTTALEDENFVGPTLLPLVDVRDRRIKRGTMEIEAFGMAQMKARNSTPPIFIPSLTVTEEYIELADIDEMSPIEEDEWEKLTGDNEFERNRVGVEVLQRARILQLRNERRTEWLRWQAMYDALTITMADEPGQQMWLRYGIPPANKVTASPLWSNRATSTPITNIRAAQKYLFTTLGKWGSRIYMGPDTWENLAYSAEVTTLLNTNTGGGQKLPTVSTIESLLYNGVGSNERPRPGAAPAPTVTVTSAGFRDSGQGTNRGANALTYFLPEGRVLVTTEPTISGENLGDMPNGRVAVKPAPTSEPEWRQGPQTETLVSSMPPYTHYTRQVCVRIPRINIPSAFYWLQVA
jgi:hypothetical protein